MKKLVAKRPSLEPEEVMTTPNETPQVGKVYWVRLKDNAPFKAEITAIHRRVIEYCNRPGGIFDQAAMLDELEIVEETIWE